MSILTGIVRYDEPRPCVVMHLSTGVDIRRRIREGETEHDAARALLDSISEIMAEGVAFARAGERAVRELSQDTPQHDHR